MDEKEEKIQKALGTFDHFKCVKCGKVTYKDKLAVPVYNTIYDINGPPIRQYIGIKYQCTCGSKDFE
jgi:NAD-dependent SIR2 family protein deacetylase